ncbi:transcriptional regulator with XRE-family HTH domain [Ruminiclostridium sufflavum DSM 19573]|uniref:Transcriptional regulator with XRE-family HTH domain n=1 Tax=Ruminiclostridium sufflavum DSM 19573 TaxID=1121337 RepID=A0A318XN26_9FIRM|nr:helix-turn-helix transcriptional regulator [Ruminiclostridium sufflavum]PYG87347.1 transcriptional regulator with XRE-family HTH domain [Ruminiclostridium sufflavum DSM 19573]
MDTNILGKRIKKLREKKHLNQLEFSKILNISNTTLSQYEAGNRTPSDEIKEKVADYFNVSVDYLLGRTEKFNTEGNPPESEHNSLDVSDLPEEAVRQIEDYVEYLKLKYGSDK